jgi:D-galactarolactone isomerase
LHPPDVTPADYHPLQAELGLERVVIVQPTTYGLDNRVQLAAAAEFGGNARVVVVVDESVEEDELRHLSRLGVRGARNPAALHDF